MSATTINSNENKLPQLKKLLNETKAELSSLKTQLQAVGNEPEDLDNKEVFGNLGLKINTALEFAMVNNLTAELLDEIINNLQDYVFEINSWIGGHTVNLLPFLSECSCVNSSNFNRCHNTRRQDLEKEILSYAEENLSIQEKLHYLSLGSGGLLQDFVLIGKLLLQGYQDIEVNLVEPDLDERSLQQFNFLMLVAQQKGIKLTINHFTSIQECQVQQPQVKYQLISAIDFDDHETAFADVMTCQSLVASNGRFYLAYGKTNLCFDSIRCVKQDQVENKIVTHIGSDHSSSEHANKEHLHIAVVSDTLIDYKTCKKLLTQLARNPHKKISLTMLQPKKLDYFGNSTEDNNPQFNSANLTQYFKLFMPTDVEIEVNLVSDAETLKKRLLSGEMKFDTAILSAFMEENTIQPLVQNLTSISAQTEFYFFIVATRQDLNSQQAVPVLHGFWRHNQARGMRVFLEQSAENVNLTVEDLLSTHSKETHAATTTTTAASLSSVPTQTLRTQHYQQSANEQQWQQLRSELPQIDLHDNDSSSDEEADFTPSNNF